MRWPRALSPPVLAFLALCVALPVGADALRGPRGPGCALDGVTLVGAPVVRVLETSGVERTFCCVRCATTWLETTQAMPEQILVTDAVAGTTLDARDAWFVRSSVASQAATQDAVHAFATEAAAQAHAKNYRGRVLKGAARPFGAGN